MILYILLQHLVWINQIENWDIKIPDVEIKRSETDLTSLSVPKMIFLKFYKTNKQTNDNERTNEKKS